MKALTLTQPWATLIAIGAKKIETRSWSTNYRGKILIHAAKAMPNFARDVMYTDPFLDAIADGDSCCADIMEQRGHVLCMAQLIDSKRIGLDTRLPLEPEYSFGDYTIGRFMWILDGVVKLPKPIPMTGMQGLWEYTGTERLF